MWKIVLSGIIVVAVVFGSVGCSSLKGVNKVNKVISKDIPIEEQLALLEKYQGTHAWARGLIEDITEREEVPGEPKKRIVLRDTKITIIDMNFSYNGAITIEDPKRKRIDAGLAIERPLSVEKIEDRLNELFWFQDPVLRQVAYIRQWGKKTAQSVVNHEVFVGMPEEAAMESWGFPDEIRVSEIGGGKEAQWVYKEGKRNRYIYVLDGKVARWEE
ncbi:MAG: hypothetical protein JSW50_10855 [Candidatus Latescibacterota bacterium]|nr:MAG: hypothetical protein JSW50_10855 [Candidatus Latescibacterota bacterium]